MLASPSQYQVKQAARGRQRQEPQKNVNYLGKNLRIMNYVAYEIKRSKETATGTRYLVRCNRLGKYAITTWVGSTGSSMGTVECQGKRDYVLKKWDKIVGNRQKFH